MINRTPEIMLDAVNRNKNLVNMPAQKRIRPLVFTPFADFRSRNWPETIAMADIDVRLNRMSSTCRSESG